MRDMNKPMRDMLIEVREEMILMLYDMEFGPTEIGFIMNKMSKQLVSHVLKKHIKK